MNTLWDFHNVSFVAWLVVYNGIKDIHLLCPTCARDSLSGVLVAVPWRCNRRFLWWQDRGIGLRQLTFSQSAHIFSCSSLRVSVSEEAITSWPKLLDIVVFWTAKCCNHACGKLRKGQIYSSMSDIHMDGYACRLTGTMCTLPLTFSCDQELWNLGSYAEHHWYVRLSLLKYNHTFPMLFISIIPVLMAILTLFSCSILVLQLLQDICML